MPGIKIKLRPISDSIDRSGVYGPNGEYPVGTVFTLPEGVELAGSGYERHEVVTKATTADHEAVHNGGEGEEPEKPPARYAARETSPGWFAIYEGETQITKKVRKADADAFEVADEAAQAVFIEDNKFVGEAV